MDRDELKFWLAVGFFSIAFLAMFKIVAAQPWTPQTLKEFAGSL